MHFKKKNSCEMLWFFHYFSFSLHRHTRLYEILINLQKCHIICWVYFHCIWLAILRFNCIYEHEKKFGVPLITNSHKTRASGFLRIFIDKFRPDFWRKSLGFAWSRSDLAKKTASFPKAEWLIVFNPYFSEIHSQFFGFLFHVS